MLNRQIIIDPRVKGTITVYSEQPVSVGEAYRNYLAALRGLGFTVVEAAGFLKVLPEPDAKLQAGSVAIETSNVRGDQILTQIFRIQHENANNLVAVLRPLISPNNTINANPGNNSLVITDYADNLQRMAKIIAAMDTPGTSDIEIVPLKHAVAADLAPLVQRLADGGSTVGAAVPGQSSSAVNVLVDPRSNGLILRASNPARLAAVRSMVDKLDQPRQRRRQQHPRRLPEERRCRQARDRAAGGLRRRLVGQRWWWQFIGALPASAARAPSPASPRR